MAENKQDEIIELSVLPTPSTFLNLLISGKILKIGGNIVRYSKSEYSIVDSDGKKIFSRIPNAMSFWELCLELGIEEKTL